MPRGGAACHAPHARGVDWPLSFARAARRRGSCLRHGQASRLPWLPFAPRSCRAT